MEQGFEFGRLLWLIRSGLHRRERGWLYLWLLFVGPAILAWPQPSNDPGDRHHRYHGFSGTTGINGYPDRPGGIPSRTLSRFTLISVKPILPSVCISHTPSDFFQQPFEVVLATANNPGTDPLGVLCVIYANSALFVLIKTKKPGTMA